MPRPSSTPAMAAIRHTRGMFMVFCRGFSSALASAAGAGSLFSGIRTAAPHWAHLPRFPARVAGARSWASHFLHNVTIVFGTARAGLAPSL